MARRKPSEEVEVFSFSFLDILACTVGALAFILTILMLDIAGRFQKDDVLEQAQQQLERLQEELAELQEANQKLADRKDQLDQLLAQLNPRAERLQRDAKQAVAQASQRERAAEQAKIEADELARQEQKEQLRLASLQQSVQKLNQRQDQLEQEKQQLAEQREQWNQKLAELKQKAKQVAEEYEHALKAKEENRRLTAQFSSLQTAAQKKDAANRAAQRIINEVAGLEKERQELNKQLAETQAAIEQAKEQQEKLAQQADQELATPPYWLVALVWGVLLVLLIWWLVRRSRLPKGSPDQLKQEIQEHEQAIAELKEKAKAAIENMENRDAELADSGDLQGIKEKADAAVAQAEAAEAEQREAEDRAREMEKELRDIQSENNSRRRNITDMQNGDAQVAPRAIVGPGGTDRRPTHVDCDAQGLLIHPQQTRVSMSQISNSRSPYGQLVREVARDSRNRCLVLWIRPNGYDSFQKAREAAQECRAGVGWEPADREWDFVFD